MGDPSLYEGRVAHFVRDNSFVLIESFHRKRNEFIVRSLTKTNGHPQVATCQAEELELATSDEFKRKYPNAPMVGWTSEMVILPTDTEIDFSLAGLSYFRSYPKPLIVFGSCRVTGAHIGRVGYKPAHRPATQIVSAIRIETDNGDDIVEFENINFTDQVVCATGQVLFRTCTFSGSMANALQVGTSLTSAKVTLDTCGFANCPNSAVIVKNGHLSMINCMFSDMGVGVCVKAGQSMLAYHCVFHTSVGGVLVRSRCDVRLLHCTFLKLSDFAVGIRKNSKLRLVECLVEGCIKEGIVIEDDAQRLKIVVKCTVSTVVLGDNLSQPVVYCLI